MTFHLELDDVHRTSHTHPGVCVIPAGLALCEEKGLSGKDLLTAVVAGYDVVIRIGMGVSPSIYVDRVFLAPGTLGVFGAATVAAKLQGLTATQIAGVLGTASYLAPLAPFESFSKGAPAKETIMGWCGMLGIDAVDLANCGFSGPTTSIEGQFGYCKAVSERYDLSRITGRLGEVFEIMNTGIKPYACCRQHHSAIDAVLEIREKEGLTPEKIKSIRCRTFKVASRGSDKAPTTIGAAKYSAPYTIAVTFLFGKAWREQYTLDLINDPTVAGLAAKVEVSADADLEKLYDEKWPAIVEVETLDGRTLQARRDIPKGEPEYPVSDVELQQKFMSLAGDAVSKERASEIWEMIFDLENLNNLSVLTSALTCTRAEAVSS
jgi:2-methylcitrate dehydratase PrpD